MGYVLQSLRQRLHHLFIYSARDTRTPKGAVHGDHAIECSALAFFEEFGPVCSFGAHELGKT